VEYKKYVKIPSLAELLVEMKRDEILVVVTIILVFKEVVGK
jgi:hypothetical protein